MVMLLRSLRALLRKLSWIVFCCDGFSIYQTPPGQKSFQGYCKPIIVNSIWARKQRKAAKKQSGLPLQAARHAPAIQSSMSQLLVLPVLLLRRVERRRGLARRVLLLAALASPAVGVSLVGGVACVSPVAGAVFMRVRLPRRGRGVRMAEPVSAEAVPPISCKDERTPDASFMRHLLARSASLRRCAWSVTAHLPVDQSRPSLTIFIGSPS